MPAKNGSPDIEVIGFVEKGQRNMPRKIGQSDECQPSRDILEIISILGYLWKIPAPHSGADNGCHTLQGDVDRGRIRFTQTAHIHTRRVYVVLLV